MKKEKEEKIWTHFLRCSKCSFKFQLETPESNNTKIGVDKMSCPVCKKPVMLDTSQFGGVSTKPSMASQGRMNIEASMMALKMAGEQKKADEMAGVGKMVGVSPPPQERGKSSFQIPEKVVSSIEKKIIPELELLE